MSEDTKSPKGMSQEKRAKQLQSHQDSLKPPMPEIVEDTYQCPRTDLMDEVPKERTSKRVWKPMGA
jgi:hypothetical protein